jgi:hypothetical protein
MAVLAKIAMECVHHPLLWLFVASLVFVILQTRRLCRAPFSPGPKPLPIIGNMALVYQLTHRGLGALAKQYGGLLHLRRVDAGVRAGGAAGAGRCLSIGRRYSCGSHTRARG